VDCGMSIVEEARRFNSIGKSQSIWDGNWKVNRQSCVTDQVASTINDPQSTFMRRSTSNNLGVLYHG